MNYGIEPIIINTDDLSAPVTANGLWENRAAAYHMFDVPEVPKCSIVVLAYNRLKKTKYCVECIINYTQDVDYELILVDNGSDDGTLEFFQSVPYEKKQIIKITKNIGLSYAITAARNFFSGKYLIIIPCDVYVTKNWLSNLITCYESDPGIGFVTPVSSNVSNFQTVDLAFSDFDDMQKKAAEFNKSAPSKWEERMRLINVVSIFSRPVLDIVGLTDSAFVHDFLEDDLAARLRRSGYKLMLCRDTWVCHDHGVLSSDERDPVASRASLASGRRIYLEKYHGIDAWDDINNFELTLSALLETAPLPDGKLRSLVVDGRCGTPVLEIRNKLRRRNITDIESHAFTTQAKYYLDLQTVSDDVQCDRIDFIQSCYADNTFDIVALCEPVNTYPSPITLLQRLYNFLKPGGILLFKLRNTDNFNAFLRSAGIGGVSDGDLPAVLPLNDVPERLKLFGGRDISITMECESLNKTDLNTLLQMLHSVKSDANNNDLTRLITKNYVFRVTKG